MKRIKLFFLTFLSVCLGLTSFSSADFVFVPGYQNEASCFIPNFTGYSYTFSNGVYMGSPCLRSWYDDWNNGTSYQSTVALPDMFSFSIVDNYWDSVNLGIDGAYLSCTEFGYLSDGLSDGFIPFGRVSFSDGLYTSFSDLYTPSKTGFDDYMLVCSMDNMGFGSGLYQVCKNSNGCESYQTPLESSVNLYYDIDLNSNFRQCLEDKNQLIGQVSTLSGSLTSCQSDLSDCRGGQDASLLACIDQKEQCETSLTTLSGNYASLENMNSSLSSQLQECLESSSNLTGELICNKFDLFWSSDNTDYSFPINNDLILPSGYKGFVNEGVLAIKPDSSLDSAYSIDDEEFQDVIDSYGVVFLYMFGSSLFLVFLYMIRKYFIGLKS